MRSGWFLCGEEGAQPAPPARQGERQGDDPERDPERGQRLAGFEIDEGVAEEGVGRGAQRTARECGGDEVRDRHRRQARRGLQRRERHQRVPARDGQRDGAPPARCELEERPPATPDPPLDGVLPRITREAEQHEARNQEPRAPHERSESRPEAESRCDQDDLRRQPEKGAPGDDEHEEQRREGPESLGESSDGVDAELSGSEIGSDVASDIESRVEAEPELGAQHLACCEQAGDRGRDDEQTEGGRGHGARISRFRRVLRRRQFRYRGRVFEATLLILNPASGRGAAGRVADRLVARARDLFAPLETVLTQAPGDAERIARDAVRRGFARILVAGGDGTIGEVVTGLLSAAGEASSTASDGASSDRRQPVTALPRLGLLPIGSGCDLARTLGISRRLDEALAVAAAGHVLAVDAARIAACDGQGRRQVRYFANEASTGLSARTVERVDGHSLWIGARLGFLAGALAAVAAHRPFEAALELDGERVFEGPLSLCVIGNGCYFGAGMRVAPRAALDDGLLEVVLVRALARRAILANLPAFYLGRHGAHPRVSFHAARRIALLPKGAAESVEIDGESGFALPLEVECRPAALRVYTPAATEVEGSLARASAPFVPRVAPAPVALSPAARGSAGAGARMLARIGEQDRRSIRCRARDRSRA